MKSLTERINSELKELIFKVSGDLRSGQEIMIRLGGFEIMDRPDIWNNGIWIFNQLSNRQGFLKVGKLFTVKINEEKYK